MGNSVGCLETIVLYDRTTSLGVTHCAHVGDAQRGTGLQSTNVLGGEREKVAIARVKLAIGVSDWEKDRKGKGFEERRKGVRERGFRH